ncbi:hypothetical protein DFH11DRAFT_574402 [Phellopilus nigrolimitatus]|nr:hypothetical protein DFH11DRAFT_574402 [Phellopilus nigrolimitatus]
MDADHALQNNFHSRHNYADGDIILKSSDNVLFRVHSFLLKASSVVFRHMFEMPHDEREPPDAPITLAEKSGMVATLMDLIYPVDKPPVFKSFSDMEDVVHILDKYEMHPLCVRLEGCVLANDRILKRLGSIDLYVFAAKLGWAGVARYASRLSLDEGIMTTNSLRRLWELEKEDICLLLELHWKRREQLLRPTDILGKLIDADVLPAADDENPTVWTCGCKKVKVTFDDADSAFLDLKQNVSGYLDTHPFGAELQYAFRWEKLGAKVWELKCKACGDRFCTPESLAQETCEEFKNFVTTI